VEKVDDARMTLVQSVVGDAFLMRTRELFALVQNNGTLESLVACIVFLATIIYCSSIVRSTLYQVSSRLGFGYYLKRRPLLHSSAENFAQFLDLSPSPLGPNVVYVARPKKKVVLAQGNEIWTAMECAYLAGSLTRRITSTPPCTICFRMFTFKNCGLCHDLASSPESQQLWRLLCSVSDAIVYHVANGTVMDPESLAVVIESTFLSPRSTPPKSHSRWIPRIVRPWRLTSDVEISCSSLVSLDLSTHALGDTGAMRLASLLASNKSSLQRLTLSSCRIGPRGGYHLAKILGPESLTRIVSIDLGHNKLGREGVLAIAEALRLWGATSITTEKSPSSSPLVILNLNDNGLSVDSAFALIDSLRFALQLRILDLFDNPDLATVVDSKEYIGRISFHPALRRLGLGGGFPTVNSQLIKDVTSHLLSIHTQRARTMTLILAVAKRDRNGLGTLPIEHLRLLSTMLFA